MAHGSGRYDLVQEASMINWYLTTRELAGPRRDEENSVAREGVDQGGERKEIIVEASQRANVNVRGGFTCSSCICLCFARLLKNGYTKQVSNNAVVT